MWCFSQTNAFCCLLWSLSKHLKCFCPRWKKLRKMSRLLIYSWDEPSFSNLAELPLRLHPMGLFLFGLASRKKVLSCFNKIAHWLPWEKENSNIPLLRFGVEWMLNSEPRKRSLIGSDTDSTWTKTLQIGWTMEIAESNLRAGKLGKSAEGPPTTELWAVAGTKILVLGWAAETNNPGKVHDGLSEMHLVGCKGE